MAGVPIKRVAFGQEGRSRCFPSCPRLIYDDPHVFQVRSERPSSHCYACESCMRKAHRQRTSGANNSHSKRCSRLPPTPEDFEPFNRPQTAPFRRTPHDCNWENFMKNKSRYAIQTPYANCNLINYGQNPEDRPPFTNYGGQYRDRQFGEKRTFNSLAVHQLKHQEVDDERVRSVFRERRLRQQAEDYFREMQRRRQFQDSQSCSSTED